MAELNCSAMSCAYNSDKKCTKGDILVGGREAACANETCCESFSVSGTYRNACGCDSRNVSIDCEATGCAYNRSCKCTAGHVEIKGAGACQCGETECATFAE